MRERCQCWPSTCVKLRPRMLHDTNDRTLTNTLSFCPAQSRCDIVHPRFLTPKQSPQFHPPPKTYFYEEKLPMPLCVQKSCCINHPLSRSFPVSYPIPYRSSSHSHHVTSSSHFFFLSNDSIFSSSALTYLVNRSTAFCRACEPAAMLAEVR